MRKYVKNNGELLYTAPEIEVLENLPEEGYTDELIFVVNRGIYRWDGSKWDSLVAVGAPKMSVVGELLSTYATIDDDGWLFCDGSTFDPDEYPELYEVLQSDTLPDYREKYGVVAGENASLNKANSDVFQLGEVKNPDIISHTHDANEATHNHPVASKHVHRMTTTSSEYPYYKVSYVVASAGTSSPTQSIRYSTLWQFNNATASYTIGSTTPSAPTINNTGTAGKYMPKTVVLNYYIRSK